MFIDLSTYLFILCLSASSNACVFSDNCPFNSSLIVIWRQKYPTIPEVDQPLSIKDGKKQERKDEKPEDELKNEENKNLCIERLEAASIEKAIEQQDNSYDAQCSQGDLLRESESYLKF